MNICMFTNTYLPHVGGVARSVSFFSEDLRKMGHRVLIIAPTFSENNEFDEDQKEILRMPAIQNFNGSDFSVRIALPFIIDKKIDEFGPDIIHSHHPFLLGDAALRAAHRRRLPLVFTHHTLYEDYTHYVPLDSELLKNYVINLATEYANLCTKIIAPSRSIAALLQERGVNKPVEEIPTGVDTEFFARGHGARFRKSYSLSDNATIIGHLGRLAPEKNLEYLAKAVVFFLTENSESFFLVAGSGSSETDIRRIFRENELDGQLIMPGIVEGQQLRDVFKAMDMFVFASKTETQGMVLTEAMATGKPVIALDAPGAREVVQDGENGFLLQSNTSGKDFAKAIAVLIREIQENDRWRKAALNTAEKFSRKVCAERMVRVYESVLGHTVKENQDGLDLFVDWDRLLRIIKTEWELFSQKTKVASEAIKETLIK